MHTKEIVLEQQSLMAAGEGNVVQELKV